MLISLNKLKWFIIFKCTLFWKLETIYRYLIFFFYIKYQKYLSHLASTWNNALKWIKERLFDFLGRKELCFFTLNQKMFTTRDKNQIIICLPKNQYFFFFKFYQNFLLITAGLGQIYVCIHFTPRYFFLHV